MERLFAGIAAVLTVAAGLAARRWLPPGFWSKYSGVALYAVLVYTLVIFMRPRISVGRGMLVALAISWVIEFAQISPVPAWLSSKHWMLRLIFGESFSLGDLPAYAAGVLVGGGVHGTLRCFRTPIQPRRP